MGAVKDQAPGAVDIAISEDDVDHGAVAGIELRHPPPTREVGWVVDGPDVCAIEDQSYGLKRRERTDLRAVGGIQLRHAAPLICSPGVVGDPDVRAIESQRQGQADVAAARELGFGEPWQHREQQHRKQERYPRTWPWRGSRGNREVAASSSAF